MMKMIEAMPQDILMKMIVTIMKMKRKTLIFSVFPHLGYLKITESLILDAMVLYHMEVKRNKLDRNSTLGKPKMEIVKMQML